MGYAVGSRDELMSRIVLANNMIELVCSDRVRKTTHSVVIALTELDKSAVNEVPIRQREELEDELIKELDKFVAAARKDIRA